VVICLERGADLHMAHLMLLPLTVSCFSKIQIGFTFLVPADPGSPGKGAVKWVYANCFIKNCVRAKSGDLTSCLATKKHSYIDAVRTVRCHRVGRSRGNLSRTDCCQSSTSLSIQTDISAILYSMQPKLLKQLQIKYSYIIFPFSTPPLLLANEVLLYKPSSS